MSFCVSALFLLYLLYALKFLSADEVKNILEFNKLAFDMQKILSPFPNNTCFSPFSVLASLSMVYLGARGNTAQELQTALGFKETKTHNEFSRIMQHLKGSSEDYCLNIANAALFQSSYPILSEYKNDLSRFYQALTREVDFRGDTRDAVQAVNAWICKHTKNQIHEILSDTPSNSTSMLLLNAVYFHGNWRNPFNSKFTITADFHNGGTSGSSVSRVPMMRIQQRLLFYHSQGEKFCAVQLPYKRNEVSMVILLPEEVDGLRSLVEHLTSENLQKTLDKMEATDVELYLPKFQFETTLELKDALRSLGVKEAFSEMADLSGISVKQGLFLTQILHKTVIEVTEVGTKAASVTEVDATDRSLVFVDRVVRVDHPFLFFIIHDRTGIILFAGSVKSL